MLPLIVTVVLAAMNKRSLSEGLLKNQQGQLSNYGMMELLSGFSDAGGDGAIVDDDLRINARALVHY